MRVSVEIVPFGEEKDKYTIETLYIGNMGDSDQVKGATYYQAWKNIDPRGKKPRPKPHCEVHHFRQDGALKLTELVCEKLRGVNE